MKIKLSQIVGSREALQRLAGERFPANIAYRIQKNIQALAPDGTAFQKAKDELVKAYGNPIEGEPDQYSLMELKKNPDKYKAFTDELQKLLDEEVDIQIMTLKLDILHDITPLDLMALEYMVEIPSEDPPAKPAKHRKRSGKGE